MAVLAARMAASRGDHAGHGDSLLPDQPRPRPRNSFPKDDFVGPLPGDAIRNQPRWRWPQDFVQGLVRWARALAWMPGPAKVSWAEVALDYEVLAGRVLLASPDHRLRGTRLPLGERAQVVRKAGGLVERHLVAGILLRRAPLGGCCSLLPLGGHVCAGLSARPFFTARHKVMVQAMIASLQRQIASLEGLINTLRRDGVAGRASPGTTAPWRGDRGVTSRNDGDNQDDQA